LNEYWSGILTDLHKVMINYRWIEKGRPRGKEFVSFDEYKNAKIISEYRLKRNLIKHKK